MEMKPTNPAAPVRPARRKRRLGQSPLTRSTIQEYGIYDKEMDSFKTKFINLFHFLDPISQEIKRQGSEKQALQKHVEGIQEFKSFAPSSHVSFEEELQLRLERMTSIAKTMKGLYMRERERSLRLVQQSHLIRERCFSLVGEMVQHFTKQTGILQHQLVEMDSSVEELEQDKAGLRRAYENMVTRAASIVEGLEMDLIKADLKIQEQLLEIQGLKDENSVLKSENSEIRNAAKGVETSVADLDRRLVDLERKLDSAEVARQHFEILLDIAISKLHQYEGEENRLTKLWKKILREKASTENDQHMKRSQTDNCSGLNNKSCSLPHIAKRRLPSDSMSITSFETATSEMSLAMQDDKSLSASMKSLNQKSSPKAHPKKKKKRHPFRNFLKRSVSQDSQIQHIGGSSERLPPIHDEGFEGPQMPPDSKSTEAEVASAAPSSNQDDSVFGEPLTTDSLLTLPDAEVTRADEKVHRAEAESSNVQTNRNTGEKVQERVRWFEEKVLAVEEDQSRHQPDQARKIKRTSSFGGIKSPRSGLMALARDIEKKFKRRRRSKTADFSDLVKVKHLSIETKESGDFEE